MGMFDTVDFEGKLPLNVPEGLEKGWQTKDLYNCLYNMVIKDFDTLHYKDAKGNLHFLPLTKTFEVHNYQGDERKSLTIRANHGIMVECTRAEQESDLPHIPAMSEDADEWAQGFEHTIETFKKIRAERPFTQKVAEKFRLLKFDLGTAASALKHAFKRFFNL